MINLSDYFYYDETSITFLRHKIDRLNVKKDSVAGSRNHHSGYSSVKLHNKSYQTHRVIWCLFNSVIEDFNLLEIDHIDGNRMNNNINNLRLVLPEINKKNKLRYKSNKSGITGVSYNPTGYWVAHWYEDSTFKSKYFSVKKYTEIQAKELAVKFRKNIINTLKEKGIYTNRHGEERNFDK